MTVCDLCKGTGKLLKPWYDTTGAMTGMTGDICFKCDGKGTIGEPITNEEYLRSCTTEQLADVFYMVFHNHADRVLNAFWDKHKDVFKKDIVEWLKQPHTVKE